MKRPSVTGRNAHVPYVPVAAVMALACCKTRVSFLTRHWKMLSDLLPNGTPVKQPTFWAKEK